MAIFLYVSKVSLFYLLSSFTYSFLKYTTFIQFRQINKMNGSGVLHLFVPHITSSFCLPIVYRLDNGAGGL